jgi:hypothetical protein
MPIYLCAASALALVVLMGCGDDVKPPAVETENNGAQNNGVQNNGAQNNGAQNNGAQNNGVPDVDLDAPAEIRVSLDPVRVVYRTGLKVLPVATVYSGRGHILEETPLTWTFAPGEGGELQDTGRFLLLQEGYSAIEACATVDGREEPVCGVASLVVDDGPPKIEILEPAGGAQLDVSAGDTITVRGTVVDSHGEVRAYMDGGVVPLAEDGTFEVEFVPRFGVNHIEVIATDGLHSIESRAAVDVLWAERYHAMGLGDQMYASFDDGMFIRLGQDFFDDRERLRITDPSDVRTEDLVGVVELRIQEIDFLSHLPNPLAEGRTLSLRMTDFEVRDPIVQVDISDEGIELYIRLEGVRVSTEGHLLFQGERLDLSGGINATISGFATVRFQKAGLGQPYDVDAGSFELALDDASSHFASPEANAVFDLGDSALRQLVEGELVGGLGEGFLNSVPAILVGALQDLERAIDGQRIDVNSGFGSSIRADLEAEMGEVDAVTSTHILGTMQTAIRSDQRALFPDSRGVASMVPEGSRPVFFSSSRFQTGVRMTMINGLLHTFWQGGMLNLDVVESLPPEFSFVTSAARTEAKLPPVLGPPRDRESGWDLELHLGQLEFEAVLDDRTDVYAFNIRVGVYVLTEDGRIRIDVEEEPIIIAWSVGSTHEDGTFFDAEGLTTFMLLEIWPDIAEQMRRALDVRLPTTELRQLGELAPTLSDFQIAFVLGDRVALESGYLVFDGNLVGRADITE